MQVKLNTLPATLAEFQALPRSTPEEVCAGFLCALNLYTKSPNDGVAAMDLLRGPRPMTPYDSQFLRDRLRGKEYLPLAYFDGATPQNGYRPTAPYTLTVLPDQRPQDVEEGYLRVFLQTAGAPGEAAAEAVDGRVVPLGVFQPAQRYPDTGLAGPVGVKLRSILL